MVGEKESMKTVFKYLFPYRRRMALGLSIKISGTLVELLLPYILSHILDVVVPRHSITQVLLWGGAMLLCAIGAYYGNVTVFIHLFFLNLYKGCSRRVFSLSGRYISRRYLIFTLFTERHFPLVGSRSNIQPSAAHAPLAATNLWGR